MVTNSRKNKREFNYYYKITIENEVTENELLKSIRRYAYQSLMQFNPGKEMSLGYSAHYFFREINDKGLYEIECDIIDFTLKKTAIEVYLYNKNHAKLIVKWFGVYE